MVLPHPHDALRAYVDRIRHALPVWASRGFDGRAGRFRERLDWAGDPLDVPHRAMVQARQIYVFAHAARLGWYDEGAVLAETAMASLLRDFMEEGASRASFAFSIDPTSARIVSPVRDAYAHAFVLFSIAAVHRLNRDPRLLDLADKIFRFLDEEMTDPVHGGLFDALPADTRDKRQNPHMHLLEACLFLEAAAPGRGYADRAVALVRLFRERFFRSQPGILLEYFAQDWSSDQRKTLLWEPGHHFEWVWLLGEHEHLTGEKAEPWLSTLYANAVRHGIAANGLIYDELSDDLAVLKASHRVWPHTEAIKAAATRHQQGDPDAATLAEGMATALLGSFLDRPFEGGWTDHIALDGAPLVDYVPASSLYHLFLAAAEAARVFLARAAPVQPAA